jgi:uncharacterized protein YodC (DUF2158 family)
MDKNSDLNVGAIVQLRSGGPKMTVEEVLSSSNIYNGPHNSDSKTGGIKIEYTP